MHAVSETAHRKVFLSGFLQFRELGTVFFLDFVSSGRRCPSGKERDSISEMPLFLDIFGEVEVCCRGRNRTRRTVII